MTQPITREVILSRRRFVIGSSAVGAAGLGIGLILPSRTEADADLAVNKTTPDHEQGSEVTAWVVISPDNRVTLRIARSEMGQGTLTGLAQLIAEELACDWDTVDWEFPTPRPKSQPWAAVGQLFDRW